MGIKSLKGGIKKWKSEKSKDKLEQIKIEEQVEMQVMMERKTLIKQKYTVPDNIENVEELLMQIHNKSLVEI